MKKVIAIAFLVLGIALVVLGAVGSATRAISGEATISFILIGVGVIIFAAASCCKYENESEGCDRKNDRPVLRAQNESRNGQGNGRPVYYLPPDKSEDMAIEIAINYELLNAKFHRGGVSIFGRMYFIAALCLQDEPSRKNINMQDIGMGISAMWRGAIFDGVNFAKIGYLPVSDEDYLCALALQMLVLLYKNCMGATTTVAVAQSLFSADVIRTAISTTREMAEELPQFKENATIVGRMFESPSIMEAVKSFDNQMSEYIAKCNCSQ